MKVNLKTKIKYKGQEYSSVEELPPEARSAYEKAIAADSATISTKIVFNEREYASPEQMPAAERQLYEDAMKVKRNATNVSLAKCRVGCGGKIFDCDMSPSLRPLCSVLCSLASSSRS